MVKLLFRSIEWLAAIATGVITAVLGVALHMSDGAIVLTALVAAIGISRLGIRASDKLLDRMRDGCEQ